MIVVKYNHRMWDNTEFKGKIRSEGRLEYIVTAAGGRLITIGGYRDGPRYIYRTYVMEFKDEQDAVAFKLRFGL